MRHFLRRNTFAGFTLLELLVVITIISILVAILTVNFQQARENARNKAMLAAMAETQLALEVYKSQDTYGHYPATLADLVSGGFIDETPQESASGNGSNICDIVYETGAGGTFYKLTAENCYVAESSTTGIQPDSQFARCPSWCGSQGGVCGADAYNATYEQSPAFYESLAIYSLGGECL